MQVLGENVAGPVPEPASPAHQTDGPPDTAGQMKAESMKTGATGRQAVVFPYEHAPAIATTFDIAFHLPDVTLVACTSDSSDDGFSGVSGAEGAQSHDSGVSQDVQVGKLRSELVTWRMLRYVATHLEELRANS